MKSIKLLILSISLLLGTVLSLSAQMETDIKALSNLFYHVPDEVTHRLSKVTGYNGYEDFEYTYNSHNDLSRVDHYQVDNVTGTRSLVTYEEYHYNDKKQCIEISTHSGRKGFTDLVVELREVFTYNDQGQMTNYVRWGNHNVNSDDTTLVEDQKLIIEYTAEGLPSKAQFDQLDPQSFLWIDPNFCTLEYDAKGRLHKWIASFDKERNPDNIEEITLDESGKMVILTFTDTPNSQVTDWAYTYNEQGNLTTFGRSDFITSLEYISGQEAAKTYYPRHNLGKLIISGIRNYGVYLDIPLLYNGSKEAIATRTNATNGDVSTFTYEENKPLGIEPLATPSRSKLQSDATAWTVSEATSTVALYDLQGQCLQVVEPMEGIAVISKTTVPAGTYMIQSGTQTFKVIR